MKEVKRESVYPELMIMMECLVHEYGDRIDSALSDSEALKDLGFRGSLRKWRIRRILKKINRLEKKVYPLLYHAWQAMEPTKELKDD